MIRSDRLGDDVSRVIGLRMCSLVGNPVTEPLVAMRLAGGVCGTAKRRGRSGGDRSVDPDASRDLSRIARGSGDVGIAVAGGDADNRQLREARGQGERDSVIDTRVGIDQNG